MSTASTTKKRSTGSAKSKAASPAETVEDRPEEPIAGSEEEGELAAAPHRFDDLGAAALGKGDASLDRLMDLTMPVSIELGRTRMTVQDLLRLGKSSVVELDRVAGEPVDVHVGDRLFAQGEVVVIGEHFGVRITSMVSARPGAALA